LGRLPPPFLQFFFAFLLSIGPLISCVICSFIFLPPVCCHILTRSFY
jgi:hypothetical protein